MSKFWHLAKYNIIFNKVSIAFLTFLSFAIVGLCQYFYSKPKEMGEALMQYSFYVMFMIFTGKMNAKNSIMFDIKHLVALPLSKKEIIFLKSFADTLQLLPIACVFLYGFSIVFPEYHTPIITLMVLLVITFGNVVAFNKRIDFSRMQHAKASFKNSFLFLHKYLEMMIQIVLAVLGVAIVIAVFGKNIFLQEYGFFLLILIALVMSSFNALKMLKDETRSYFIFKRDIFRIGIKLVLVGVPLFAFHQVYKSSDDNFTKNLIGNTTFEERIKDGLEKMESVANKKLMLLVIGNKEKEVSEYIKSGEEIPWESEVMGNNVIHLSVASGNKNIVEMLLKEKPDEVNHASRVDKRTPLYSALKICNLEMVEFLINHDAKIDHADIKGNTPAMQAAQRSCYGGLVLLKNKGANLLAKNKNGHTVFDFLRNNSGMAYVLKKDLKIGGPKIDRVPASKN